MNSLRFVQILLLLCGIPAKAQETNCIKPSIKHTIYSEHLQESREYWVSLPVNYDESNSYPLIFVLDAEWRFDLVKEIVFDLGGNNQINRSIVVGIPHVEPDKKRGIDLTFSHTRVEYDGDAVDSTWYNSGNSGSAKAFYNYLSKELIPELNQYYSCSSHETLVGHSYGGYFAAYLLGFNEQPFDALHIYDPSIWFGDGEATASVKSADLKRPIKVFVSYQPKPNFHKEHIESLIDSMEGIPLLELESRFFTEQSHNSLFLPSFYEGIFFSHGK